MLTKKQSLILKLLEKAFGNPLSKEQFNIVSYMHYTNILVNACAGSGKTTSAIFDIIFNEACGNANPHNTLGITFARKARKTMQLKYRHYCNRFNKLTSKYHLNIMVGGTPTFQTFHSVFYHLLNNLYQRKYNRRLPVLVNWHQSRKLSRLMYYQISNNNTMHLTKREIIKKIFEVRDQLINLGYSSDGIKPITTKTKSLIKAKKCCYSATHILYANFPKDYKRVIKTYIQGKRNLGKIDFNDMKTKIASILNRPETDPDRQQIMKDMSKFKNIYIDEFQDIDPVQWHNIRTLLPNTKDRRITAIGDDDQSIYNFRGSDPRIIVNLPKKDHTFKTFNLSTNYRTAGQIVKFISPEIEANQIRLPKSIRAHRPGGDVVQFRNNSNLNNVPLLTSGQTLIIKLLQLIHNPHINNKSICLLARDNLSREIATDMLANHKQYPKVEGGFIIQDNYDYKSFCGVAEALIYNNYNVFKQYSIRIGFNYYRKHQQKIFDQSGRNQPYKTLTEYLADAGKYSEIHPLDPDLQSNSWTEYYARIHDHQVANSMQIIQDNLNSPDIMQILYSIVQNLIKKHDQFEIKHDIAHKGPRAVIKAQILNNMSRHSNPKEFFKQEASKERHLSNYNKKNSIDILSIHAAKGLEYDYIFVFNLTDDLIQYPDVKVEQFFGPSCSWLHFLDLVTSNQLEFFLNQVPKSPVAEGLTDLSQRLTEMKQLYPDEYNLLKSYPKHLDKGWRFNQFFRNCPFLKNDSFKLLTSAYHEIIKASREVEEERRLIYVAFTRAVKCTYYDLPDKFCPLLAEADWNDQFIYTFNPINHKFTSNVPAIRREDVENV